MDLGCRRYWIFKRFLSLKIQINCQKTRFWTEKSVQDVVTLKGLPFNPKYKELGCAFGIFGKTLMSNIQWNLFCKFWTYNARDIEFEVMIFVNENSNKLQKTRFWKEKLVCGTRSHLKVYHPIQLWFPFIFNSSKIDYVPWKTISYVEFFLFCHGFTLGPKAQTTLVWPLPFNPL